MRVIAERPSLPLELERAPEPPLPDELDCWLLLCAPLLLCPLEELFLRALVLRPLEEPPRVLRLPDARELPLRLLPLLREPPLLPELALRLEPLLRELALRLLPLLRLAALLPRLLPLFPLLRELALRLLPLLRELPLRVLPLPLLLPLVGELPLLESLAL